MNPLEENIQAAITHITEYLTTHKKASSWQLKVMFRLSSSVLYLALGKLMEQGKITLEADGINYFVTWGKKSAEAVAAPVPFKAQM